MKQPNMTLVEIDLVIHNELPHAAPAVAQLQTEIVQLRQEIAVLRQEKFDLEILLETTTEHSDSVEDQLHEQALEALRQREEWFRTIAEATPVPVLISRILDGQILYANTATILASANSGSSLIGQCIWDLYLDAQERNTLIERVLQQGSVQNYEFQAQQIDGTCCWFSGSLRYLMFDDEPTILSALCDITERKGQEETLRKQIQEL
jgi:PAS domain S-box-containing protein